MSLSPLASSIITKSPSLSNTEELASSATNKPHEEGSVDDEFQIQPSAILQILPGIAAAAKATEGVLSTVSQWIERETLARTVHEWLLELGKQFPNSEKETDLEKNTALEARLLSRLSIGIAFLLESGRAGHVVTPSDQSTVWQLVQDALTSPSVGSPLFTVSRSAQGFLAVPLCSLIKDGNIDVLFRYHVWLPNQSRGIYEVGLHSHQCASQSWILAGEGTNLSYEVEQTEDYESATHSKYALSWTAENGKSDDVGDNTYKTRQQQSTVVNTGKLAKAALKASAVHTQNSSYSIPAAAYHRSEVPVEILHATLFVFDAHRGFVKDADVMGPKDSTSFTQVRDPAGVTAAELVHKVELIREWENYVEQGRQHTKRAEWEDALRVLNSALNLCDSSEFPNSSRYKDIVRGELEQAKQAASSG
ncbi:hypothetical protein INT44_005870 [Umbelopsis vinacea]|uniref:Uncharacterized protein n=1 Tax=Umbelopsis vinacea TaxID=44442 RepID=A0A8H7UL60_9FUNG|nr:hypothetical protein INT44_005870 [Umbelopsis vinacea]